MLKHLFQRILFFFASTYTYKLKFYNLNQAQKKGLLKGFPNIAQLSIFEGAGTIEIDSDVWLGYGTSPFNQTGSIYIEARDKEALISIGNNVVINNNSSIVADKTKVTIGNHTLIGVNVHISDSDGHSMNPAKRRADEQICQPVTIGDNVFIGSHVIVLKGVSIGNNSVIGSGSVVVKNIPANVIAAGNPAKIIRAIDES